MNREAKSNKSYVTSLCPAHNQCSLLEHTKADNDEAARLGSAVGGTLGRGQGSSLFGGGKAGSFPPPTSTLYKERGDPLS